MKSVNAPSTTPTYFPSSAIYFPTKHFVFYCPWNNDLATFLRQIRLRHWKIFKSSLMFWMIFCLVDLYSVFCIWKPGYKFYFARDRRKIKANSTLDELSLSSSPPPLFFSTALMLSNFPSQEHVCFVWAFQDMININYRICGWQAYGMLVVIKFLEFFFEICVCQNKDIVSFRLTMVLNSQYIERHL